MQFITPHYHEVKQLVIGYGSQVFMSYPPLQRVHCIQTLSKAFISSDKITRISNENDNSMY